MKIFEDASETDLFQPGAASSGAHFFPTSHCKLEMTSSSSQIVKNVENWLRGCRARTLEVISSKGELSEVKESSLLFFKNLKCVLHLMQYELQHVHFILYLQRLNTLIIDREKNPSCCAHYSNKCWRHYIEGVIHSNDPTVTLYAFVWQLGKTKWCEDLLADQRSMHSIKYPVVFRFFF